MGGHEAGEEAAETAIGSVRISFTVGDSREVDPIALIQAAHSRITATNRRWHQSNSGSTLTVLSLQPQRVVLAWAGDSLALRVREGRVVALNYPNNVAGQLWKQGKLTEDQYRVHPQRNLLRNGCGGGFHSIPESSVWEPAQRGDVYLLLTDGAFDPLGSENILQITQSTPFAYLAEALLYEAKKKGLDDNATFVVIQT
jgi:protein phosphatase